MSQHACTPEDAVAWMGITLVPGISIATQRALLAHYRSPHAALAASRAEIASRFGTEAAEALAKGPQAALVERTLAWLAAEDQHLVVAGDAHYPKAFLTIPDAPVAFHAKGRLDLLNAPAIAVVGSRNATSQGVRDAEAFAQALSAAGLCIVSGMALGIDAAAHRGGLAAAGSSVAVLGTGCDIIYPSRNRALAHALAERGCLISEFPIGTPSAAGNFPRRNRLISGLARGVLVVEAAMPSGSLITARQGLEQSREIFAVPGSIHSPLSKGCHDLIKQGAKLVESADDVLVELGMRASRRAVEAIAEVSEHPLLDAMGFNPVSVDELVRQTGAAASRIAAQISQLELEGRIAALPGGRFQRVTS